jgi:beta-lactamase regulating signal transducer with metallopeptidase domain
VIASLLDHIWQSTLFAGGIGLLTLCFRRNSAGLRFWLWFAASLKFLVPFALLAVLGEYLSRLFPSALPQSILAIQPAAERLSAPAQLLPHAQSADLAPLFLCVWLLGFGAILGLRLLRWQRLRAVMAEAHDLPLFASGSASVSTPVRIKASPSLLEPGLVGILEPMVLLPVGLMARLSEPERDSILAHELSHLRRRDNVTAAIHMAVEALFWFCPPVWLIGARLIAERERACDEAVLASGHDPEVYAGGILKVCKFCIQSPLACASGASGADLGHRVRMIMTAEVCLGLTPAKRLLLAGAAMLALGLPVMAGFLNTPLAVQVQRNVIAVQVRAEQAVTVVAEQIGMAPIAPVAVKKLPRLKRMAADVPLPQVESPAPSAPQPVMAAPVPQPQEVQKPAVPVVSAPLPARALKEAVLALDPRGEGDPDAVTCRAPQVLPGSRLPGPEVCKTNRIWAELRAQGQQISPDGLTLIATMQRFGGQPAACSANLRMTVQISTLNTAFVAPCR